MVQIKHLIVLAPFVLGAFASNDHNSSSDNHSDDHSIASDTLNQGGYFGGCGLANAPTGAPAQRRQSISFGNTGGGGNVQGNSCRRSEHHEAALETRDMHDGFDALNLITARSNDHNANSDDHSDDHSASLTTGNGGGYFAGCYRSMLDDEAPAERRQSITFGNTAGGGNVQGNTCRRSTQLAIKDVGAMYRRFQSRNFDEDAAVEAADILRRHAEHLGLV